jgi:hypothetical protein
MFRDLSKMGSMGDTVGQMPTGIRGKATYWYVGAVVNSQPVVLGAFPSQEMANKIGQSKLNVPFQLYSYGTKDMSEVVKKIKFQLLQSNNIPVVLRRSRHIIESEDGR